MNSRCAILAGCDVIPEYISHSSARLLTERCAPSHSLRSSGWSPADCVIASTPYTISRTDFSASPTTCCIPGLPRQGCHYRPNAQRRSWRHHHHHITLLLSTHTSIWDTQNRSGHPPANHVHSDQRVICIVSAPSCAGASLTRHPFFPPHYSGSGLLQLITFVRWPRTFIFGVFHLLASKRELGTTKPLVTSRPLNPGLSSIH